MNKIIDKLTNYIMYDNQTLDVEVVRYGIEALLSSFLCLGCAILISTILNGFFFSIIFIVFLTPIKMTFAGYHCKTLLQCICTYGICVGIFTVAYQIIISARFKIPFLIFIFIMALITIAVRSELKIGTLIILLAYTLLGFFLYLNSYNLFSILSLSCFFELLLLFMKQLNHIRK